jgi:hypothetical protein
MNRTALRISTLAALTNGGNLPYPTMVGNEVYDSEKTDLTDLLKGAKPVIIIRTDEDRRGLRDRAQNLTNIVNYRVIALRLEFGVMIAQRQDNVIIGGWPQTDQAMEAKIDLLEFQIMVALTGFGPWAVWWLDLWARESEDSMPLWDDPNSSGKIKYARRELTFMVRAPFDCPPGPLAEADFGVDTNGDPIVIKEIPPRLKAVLDKIIANGSGSTKTYAQKVVLGLLSEDLPVSDVYPMLRHVMMRQPGTAPAGHVPLTQFEADLLKPQ